jgi:hypothetical protein
MNLLREGSPDSFRLRVQALGLLERKLSACGKPSPAGPGPTTDSGSDGTAINAASVNLYLSEESDRLLQDFLAIARPRCAATPGAPDDLGPWEDLTQDVYSVGLLPRARGSDLFEQVLDAVACVHHRRALAPQTGRELGYRHAHLRYLLLLKDSAQSKALRDRIDGYATEIAATLQLSEW